MAYRSGCKCSPKLVAARVQRQEAQPRSELRADRSQRLARFKQQKASLITFLDVFIESQCALRREESHSLWQRLNRSTSKLEI